MNMNAETVETAVNYVEKWSYEVKVPENQAQCYY
jgi:hypothetical protein